MERLPTRVASGESRRRIRSAESVEEAVAFGSAVNGKAVNGKTEAMTTKKAAGVEQTGVFFFLRGSSSLRSAF